MGRLGVAAVRHEDGLGARGMTLAAVQVFQVGSGLLGQIVLLARWSPNTQTDLFLLLSSVPWLVSAAALVTGLEMALPAAYHRAQAASAELNAHRLVLQVTGWSVLVSAVAAVISGMIVGVWAARSDLSPGLSAWMGVALGAQVIPATLAGLWRGVLVARDRLVRARLTLLAGSLLTVTGYALLPGPAALALPLTAAGAMGLGAVLAWRFYGDLRPPHGEKASPLAPTSAHNREGESVLQVPLSSSAGEGDLGSEANFARRRGVSPYAPTKIAPRHPELLPLVRALIALSAAAGLVHLQTIVERAAVLSLETGAVTALTVAGRGWEAVMAVIVAACALPVYPRWADLHTRGEITQMRVLLDWSMRRAALLSLLAAGVIGVGVGIGAYGHTPLREWESGVQAAEMALILLPRFVLVSAVQPLVLKHYASGTPWYPVLGAALGVGVLALGVVVFVPRYDRAGVLLATMLSAIPGWLVLGGYEWRVIRCAS